VSSYTPTLSALLRAQGLPPILLSGILHDAQQSSSALNPAFLRAKQSPAIFAKDKVKIALVAAKEAHGSTMPILWNVEEEMKQVICAAEASQITFGQECVRGPATVTRVARALQSASFAHIACHGIQNASDALASGFCLTDGDLTVSRLMELDLKDAFFAFLSACETAKGNMEQPDQTVHLAATMLFVGFRSVIATMWCVQFNLKESERIEV
jgi:CHAT domain-containing protein